MRSCELVSRCIFIGLFMVLLAAGLSYAQTEAQNPVGMITDGYDEDCHVKRGPNAPDSRGETIKCGWMMDLYEGDIVTKTPNVNKLTIKWKLPPYTNGVPDKNMTTMRVVFNKPEKGSILPKIADIKKYFGLLEPVHIRIPGGARGGDSNEEPEKIFIPTPGCNITVLGNYPITFTCEKVSKTLVITDDGGVKILQKNIAGKSTISIKPGDMRLKPGKTTTWKIEDKTGKSFKTCKIRQLNENIANQVTNDLKEIDKKNLSESETKTQKAMYLQTFSDIFGDEVDLYWLSYELVKNLNVNKNNIALIIQDRYLDHIINEK
ncbi:MAG: hypothetical protein HQK89_10425 [Nitrospirae bacterium]|nr:hypothetical protein [Nitrospirota bacterium]